MRHRKTKKFITVTLLFLLILGNSMNVMAAERFSDVKKGSSHYDGISWLAEKGIKGYEDGTFAPNEPLSRQHAAKMFVEALDLPLPNPSEVTKHFDDIDPGYVYAKHIAAVGEAGIFTGNENDFKPKQKLNREQMASTLVRAYQFKASEFKVNINLKGVSQSHRESVQILADLDITNQLNNFRPSEDITRGQFATFLHRSDAVTVGVGKGPIKQYTTKHYNYNFSTMLKKQMALTPPPQTSSAGTWYDASEDFTQYYLNPKNFNKADKEYYQFLRLSGSSNLNTKTLNSQILKGKGILEGKGAEFKKASKENNVNEIYLVSHALLETGHGKSQLAKGIEVGTNKKGNPVRVTKSNRKQLKNIKKVYNFFGIGAVDGCAISCGSQRAYKEGWTTPEKAITGGAGFINSGYISRGQDTLYKMRWNPEKPATHQYATDAGWAVKQTQSVKNAYDLAKDIDGVVMNFETPTFNKQPGAKSLPTGINIFNVNNKHPNAGKTGIVSASALNFRTGPTTNFNSIKALPKGTKVTIIGENTNWYKVKVGKQEGWVSAGYIDVLGTKSAPEPRIATFGYSSVTPEEEQSFARESNPERIIGEITKDKAKVREEMNDQSTSIVELSKSTRVEVIEEKDDWFKIILDGTEGWLKVDDISIVNLASVKVNAEIKDQPNGKTLDRLIENETLVLMPDENLELIKEDEWYKASYQGQEVWVDKESIN